jgi:hypothetical protein
MRSYDDWKADQQKGKWFAPAEVRSPIAALGATLTAAHSTRAMLDLAVRRQISVAFWKHKWQ